MRAAVRRHTITRMLSVARDPLSDQTPGSSPYDYAGNNPLAFVDPTGLFDCPMAAKSQSRPNDACVGDGLNSLVYSPKGIFLGTDDWGLEGEPLIMAENDFRQGMPHGEAL